MKDSHYWFLLAAIYVAPHTHEYINLGIAMVATIIAIISAIRD